MLQLRQVSKSFGAFHALQSVDFTANGGEIVGLLGENGAGKSTLLNIVGGSLQPTSGEIALDGAPLRFRSSRDATQRGIGIVHQHASLVETFSAGENLALHAQNRGARIDKKAWSARVEGWAQTLGWQLDAHVAVEKLSVGERQRIEILKALFASSEVASNEEIEYSNRPGSEARGARLMLLDEPTANLTPDEADELFAVLRRLRAQNRAVVFVSHKLNEVMNLCDRVVVLRRGQVVGQREIARTSVDELAQLMIGENGAQKSAGRAAFRVLENRVPDAPFRLCVEKISAGVLRDFSLGVRGGEIVGIAGVDGNGQAELIEVLSGLRAPQNGSFRCENALATDEKNGSNAISVIPPDRQRVGLIGAFDLAENLALHPALRARCRTHMGFRWKVARSVTRDLMAHYDVRAPQTLERTRAAALSGGNQQKIVIARALEFPHGSVVAADPTRGLDIGASRFVHSQLRKAAENGAAVLVISTDLDEVLSLCDRVGVLYEGRLSPAEKLLSRDENGQFDRERIGALMGGQKAKIGAW